MEKARKGPRQEPTPPEGASVSSDRRVHNPAQEAYTSLLTPQIVRPSSTSFFQDAVLALQCKAPFGPASVRAITECSLGTDQHSFILLRPDEELEVLQSGPAKMGYEVGVDTFAERWHHSRARWPRARGIPRAVSDSTCASPPDLDSDRAPGGVLNLYVVQRFFISPASACSHGAGRR
jgi:hypothetical protein